MDQTKSTLRLSQRVSLALGLTLLLTTTPTNAFELFGKNKDIVSDSVPVVQDINTFDQPTYGVDVSFPQHHGEISDNFAWLPHNVDPANNPTPANYKGKAIQYLGDKPKEYAEFMKGCNDHYGSPKGRGMSSCEITERDRVEMSFRQPSSMQNYTELGFKKIRAPKEVWDLIKKFWDENKDRKNWQDENWPKGNTYTNHWTSPTYMVSVENTRLRGAGGRLKNAIWNAAKDTMQEWTGQELTQCSLYGVRVYTEGAMLATHVDRMPLVSSAIINVDQDLDEPWPIEVYAHDGKAYNITMEPGDMVLYESHSVLHGRPFPLKGRHYANLFVHFEPVGHSLRHNAKEAADEAAKGRQDNIDFGGHENEMSDGMPSYIVRGSDEDTRWHRSHPSGNGNKRSKQNSFSTGSTPAHRAAQEGDAKQLEQVIDKLDHLLDAKDVNGWTPLHEGARAGHAEVVELLLKRGASVNERTQEGTGGTALYWSIEQHGEEHPVSQLLKSFGAISIGPDL